MSETYVDILFQRMKKGDVIAFHKLFQSYYQPLFIFALKFVSEEQAKDFVQDCFYELWQNRKKTEISNSLSAYLFTVIKNKCYKHLKKEQKKQLYRNNFVLKLKEEEFQYYVDSEKSVLEFATKDRIEKVISRMPDKCREVFQKSRIEGFSNKEIAEDFNISVKAVEKHISKALQLFREEFKDVLSIFLFLFFKKN